jgi:hypothetical protein
MGGTVPVIYRKESFFGTTFVTTGTGTGTLS